MAIVHVKEMLTLVLRIVFSQDWKSTHNYRGDQLIEQVITNFHRHFQLRAEVESVLKHMAKN